MDVGGKGMHEDTEDEFAEAATIEYVRRVDVLTTPAFDSGPMHATLLNSIHSKEVVGYLDEIIKLIGEKEIMVDTVEEIILKNG